MKEKSERKGRKGFTAWVETMRTDEWRKEGGGGGQERRREGREGGREGDRDME